MSSQNSAAEKLIRQWIEQCVVDLSLCPFARVPYRAGMVSIVLYSGDAKQGYLKALEAELERLIDNDQTETTLIAAPKVLSDFLDFNDFLAEAEALLRFDNRDSQFQMASFHPQYQFAGVDAEDVGNYTNRSPYPIVQWLRVDTISRAVDSTDTAAIPEANIQKLEQLGIAECRKRFPWVRKHS